MADGGPCFSPPWRDHRHRQGECKPKSIDQQYECLIRFFVLVLEEDIAALTPKRAAAVYQEATESISPKTKTALAAATHRLYLRLAQSFYQWAIRQGYVGGAPFKDVKPVGKVRVGKRQLRIEEARQFTRAALSYFEEKGNPVAIGALLALMMGLCTSEVLGRVVRDLDDGARWLWIDAGKTAHARRHLEVPQVLQPYLVRLSQGKGKENQLFGRGPSGKAPSRQAMWGLVRVLCQRAEVPLVCTHSLRGLWANLAVQSGAASHVVAANLGHHSFKVTERHYAQGSAVENAATVRVLGMLGGERAKEQKSAREKLEQLDEGELARLLELLAGSNKGSAPPN